MRACTRSSFVIRGYVLRLLVPPQGSLGLRSLLGWPASLRARRHGEMFRTRRGRVVVVFYALLFLALAVPHPTSRFSPRGALRKATGLGERLRCPSTIPTSQLSWRHKKNI